MAFDLAALMQAAKQKETANAQPASPAATNPSSAQTQATPFAFTKLPTQSAAPIPQSTDNAQAQSASLSLSDEEVQLLATFRANLNHLSTSLIDPRYEIKPHDAIRAVGDIIRNNPNLASILEPQDFQLIVRNTRATAQQRANAVSATQVKREEKADLKRQASALLDDALAGQFAGAMKPVKPTAAPPKPSISGDAFASMMSDFAKGNAASTTPASPASPAPAAPPAKQSLSALFGKKKD